ncbi:MAG: hypothetical protein ACE5GW_09010 [Planctomycetota bacterium]
MQRANGLGSAHKIRLALGTTLLALWAWPASSWPQDPISYEDETVLRLVAAAEVGIANTEEKDYAWGGVDQDGDIDLVCVRKQPWNTPGRRRNVLFLNEGTAQGHAVNGVLVDRTADYAVDATDGGQGFSTSAIPSSFSPPSSPEAPSPPSPFPGCGIDPSDDALGCGASPCR